MTSASAVALADAPATDLGVAVEMVVGAASVVEAEPEAAAAVASVTASAFCPEAPALCSPSEAITGVLRRDLEPAPPMTFAGEKLGERFSPFALCARWDSRVDRLKF